VLGEGGVSGTGAAAAGAEAVGVEGGGGGTGSGQIGSTAAEPEGAGVAGVAACFRACREGAVPAGDGFGLDAAAAAAPGTIGPDGSLFIMLTGGIDAAVGKSILIGLCCGCADCGTLTSATALSDAALQSAA
jgi:hypothetical protein